MWLAAEQALYWVDIKSQKIFRLDADGQVSEWPSPFRVGSLVPRQSGGFIAGTDRGLAEVDIDAGRFKIFAEPERDRPGNRFNDGKVDRAGRFWAGSMDDKEREATGALYRIDADLGWRRVDDDYRVTNGPAFSPDGTRMYHTDSARQQIYAFPLGQDGELGDRELFAQFTGQDGYPDGMTVDSEGYLWVAFWDGWCVRRLSPKGEVVRTVDLPVQRPTSCAFGGADLDQLYVTSASVGLEADDLAVQPCAGGLFLVETGARGLAETPFAG